MRRGFLFACIQVDFDANGHNLGINLFETAFSADFLTLFDSFKDTAQRIRCRCIRRTNHSRINVFRCRYLCMAQTARNRRCRNMGRNQQRCIGVAQTMEAAGWQIMLPQKHREPRRNLVGVKRLAVGFGKQQIILDALAALYGDFPQPVCADFQTLPYLPLLIIFQ